MSSNDGGNDPEQMQTWIQWMSDKDIFIASPRLVKHVKWAHISNCRYTIPIIYLKRVDAVRAQRIRLKSKLIQRLIKTIPYNQSVSRYSKWCMRYARVPVCVCWSQYDMVPHVDAQRCADALHKQWTATK